MWIAPIVSLATVWIGALVILVSASRHAAAIRRARHATQARTAAVDAPTEPYVPHVNPWRVGSTVLVSEDLTRPELNWFGTVLQTNRGMVTVRDLAAPYGEIEVHKGLVFPEHSVL